MSQTTDTTVQAQKVFDEQMANEPVLTQTPDTPGNDENGDGVTGGQTTADNHGDILGI
jgi:hypothetical protein